MTPPNYDKLISDMEQMGALICEQVVPALSDFNTACKKAGFSMEESLELTREYLKMFYPNTNK